jgi:transcriptional regulator of acetoin/glycerol metabolism
MLTGTLRLGPGTHEPLLRPVIARSWFRMLEEGIAPAEMLSPPRLAPDALARRRRSHPLRAARTILQRVLADVGGAADLAVVTDQDGAVLWTDGAPAFIDAAEQSGGGSGAICTERAIGTNGVGLSLSERRPVQIFAGEHYAVANHAWSCSTAPVHDPLSGELIGTVGIGGSIADAHPHSLALIALAARGIEQQLMVDAQREAAQLLARPDATLSVLGRVRGLLRIGHREIEMSRRHTELLTLLWICPEGLSADQLAQELYGEHGRQGSVRTEIHRLRAQLGPLLGERPYRLRGRIACDVSRVQDFVRAGDPGSALAAYPGPPVATTSVPRLVELRDGLDDSVRAAVLESGDADLLARWLRTASGVGDVEVTRRLGILLA